MNLQEFGLQIKKKRLERKMTQTKLAELLHVSRATVSKWETGVNMPDIQNLIEISQLLELPLSELFWQDTMSDAAAAESVSHTPDQPADAVKKTEPRSLIVFGMKMIALIAAITTLILLFIYKPVM